MTQVPDAVHSSGMQPFEMRNVSRAFEVDLFTNSKLRVATLDKAAFRPVKRSGGWSGCFYQHGLSAPITKPSYEFCTRRRVFRKCSKRYPSFSTESLYLGSFKYFIWHIAGTVDVWGDLHSRWISTSAYTRSVEFRALYPEVAALEGEIGKYAYSPPSVDVGRGVQLQYIILRGAGRSGLPYYVGLVMGDQVSSVMMVSMQLIMQRRCEFRTPQKSSNHAL